MDLRIAALGLIFGLLQTAHFGWHLLPQTPAEVICDGLTLLLLALSLRRRQPRGGA